MKRGYERLLVFSAFIFLFLFINFFVINFLSGMKISLFLIFILYLFKYLFGFERDNHRYIKDFIMDEIIFLIIFFLLYYLSGLIFGFAKTNYLNYELFHVDKDNNITYINDLFPNHFSVELLGEYSGKIYLRNLWHPTDVVQVYGNQSTEVSTYNDGYFLYDGQHLEKIAPYIHCNEEIVAPNGKLYSLLGWKDEIKRIY